jgi:hypothetical protein
MLWRVPRRASFLGCHLWLVVRRKGFTLSRCSRLPSSISIFREKTSRLDSLAEGFRYSPIFNASLSRAISPPLSKVGHPIFVSAIFPEITFRTNRGKETSHE